MLILKKWHDQVVKKSALDKTCISIDVDNHFFSDTILKKAHMLKIIDIYDTNVQR